MSRSPGSHTDTRRDASGMRGARARARGFTLIEVVAAVALTAVVMLTAITIYIQISNASQRALEITREGRLATGLLDRIARDLQGAFLIETPEGEDPLNHPWFFRAERNLSSEGSDQLVFVSTTQRPRSREHSTDVAIVGYAMRPSQTDPDAYELVRAVVPGRPSDASADYPRADDPGSMVLADGLVDFSLRFLGDDGEFADAWDSGQVLRSNKLPQAVEIRVALVDERALEASDGFLEAQPQSFVRRVALPIRPISQEVFFEGAAFGDGGDSLDPDEVGNPNGCDMTWGQCINLQKEECRTRLMSQVRDTPVARQALTSCTFPRNTCADTGLCQ